MKERTYICCDLKSFYASVECIERGLNPLDTNLVVADLSRTEKTICLAVTPSLKSYGISGRARLFEVIQRVKEVNNQRQRNTPGRQFTGASSHDPEVRRNPSLALDYIVAPPRMAHYAGPFEALQIIAPDQFDLAQKLMLERTNERKERRTVPLNTTGQSLLSGNIFCGHCGGRLVLTTNGTTTRLADGTPVHKKRIRYVCYNKTRRRQECTGQTGYTMHILDGIVTEVLHQVFDKMQGASNDMIVGSAVQKQMAMIRSELQRARAENTKANKEYESLKAEVLKAIQGKSALPQDVLTEMLEDTRQKVLSTSERITTLTAELNDGNSKIEEMKAEFNRIVSWSKIFDESPMEVKKMICGYIIKKVSVFRDYRIKIEFNINVEQFLNGIDSIDECDTYELPMAQ